MNREIIEAAKRCSEHECICAVECPLFGDRSCLDEFAKAIAEHDERYRWHDLRENPDDLPEDSQQVDVCDERGNRYYTHIDIYSTNNWSRKVWHYSLNGVEPIAWREIEPFESEVSDG